MKLIHIWNAFKMIYKDDKQKVIIKSSKEEIAENDTHNCPECGRFNPFGAAESKSTLFNHYVKTIHRCSCGCKFSTGWVKQ